MAKYIRVLVECSNSLGITAQGCRPYLTRIERLEPDYRELHNDPLPLTWAHMGHQPLDIHQRMKFYFDVVAVNDVETRLQPQTTVVPETWASLLSVAGKYRFSVIVSGENIMPRETEVTFQWKGDFDSLTENSFLRGADQMVKDTDQDKFPAAPRSEGELPAEQTDERTDWK